MHSLTYGASGTYGQHFREANKALDAAIKAEPEFANMMSSLKIVIPRAKTGTILGESPANWVWQHDISPGILQLVPKSQHTVKSIFWETLHPGRRGGMSIWNK